MKFEGIGHMRVIRWVYTGALALVVLTCSLSSTRIWALEAAKTPVQKPPAGKHKPALFFPPLPSRDTISEQQSLALVDDFKAIKAQYQKLYEAKDYKASEPLMKRALELVRYLLGNNHLVVATELNSLGSLYISSKNATRSAPLVLLEALKIRQRLLKKE